MNCARHNKTAISGLSVATYPGPVAVCGKRGTRAAREINFANMIHNQVKLRATGRQWTIQRVTDAANKLASQISHLTSSQKPWFAQKSNCNQTKTLHNSSANLFALIGYGSEALPSIVSTAALLFVSARATRNQSSPLIPTVPSPPERLFQASNLFGNNLQ
jgi:methionyl-tRNA synthetase